MVLSSGATEKIPSDTTGNRSQDRPTSNCRVVTILPAGRLRMVKVHTAKRGSIVPPSIFVLFD
jgi:hypothetical protein